MVKMISSIETSILIYYGRFTILDVDGLAEISEGDHGMPDVSGVMSSPDRGISGYNMIHINKTGRDYWPDVFLEVWDGKPGIPDGYHTPTTAKAYFSSGRIYLVNVLGEGDEDEALDLGRASSHWNVQVSFRKMLGEEEEEEEEAFMIQFWPDS